MIDTEATLSHFNIGPEYTKGNPNLPIALYRDEIVDTVSDNLVTILTSGTGTGKSTQVPQFLLEHFNRIYITQPRIVAAREIRQYVSSQIADNSGNRGHNLVGYETAPESALHADNRIVVITDGLQIMREINNQGIKSGDILILDEFHERNTNMDTLLAIALEKNIRIVIMSATLDVKPLAGHCAKVTGRQVPIIEVPGVTHEVKESTSDNADTSIVNAAEKGKNILVFLPGRGEIQKVMGRIRKRVSASHTLLSLDGDQTPDEQSKVFMHYLGGKIIFSTSVGQTSITIDDIDVVVDCGYERRMILDEKGKDTLAIASSSNAVMDQRRGRVGRTKPGEYILAQFKDLPIIPDKSERELYDTPEIMLSKVDNLLLRLSMGRFALGRLPFFAKPTELEIGRGLERLDRSQLIVRLLGGQGLDSYELTERGEAVAMMPINSGFANVIERARQYGSRVELQAMAAVSVQQLSGIVNTTKGMDNWRKLSDETESDILANIGFLFAAARNDEAGRARYNVRELRYRKAWRNFDQLAKRRNLNPYDLSEPNDEDRKALISSITESFDEIYIRSGNKYKDIHGDYRRLTKSTTIKGLPDFVMGSSFNLEQATKKGITRHRLIVGATGVDINYINKVNPDRVKTDHLSYRVDEDGVVIDKMRLHIDGFDLRRTIERKAEPSIALHNFLVGEAFLGQAVTEMPDNLKQARMMIDRFKQIQLRTSEDLGIDFSVRKIIKKTMSEAAYSGTTLEELDAFIDIEAIKDILPVDIIDEILQDSPDSITFIHGKQEYTYQLTYVAGDSRAHIAAPRFIFKSIPLKVGSRRIKVATHKYGNFVNLEEARNIEILPSRGDRRNNTKEGDTPSKDPTNKTHGTARQKKSPAIKPVYRRRVR